MAEQQIPFPPRVVKKLERMRTVAEIQLVRRMHMYLRAVHDATDVPEGYEPDLENMVWRPKPEKPKEAPEDAAKE